ncbi:MAG: TRAP transporter small permease [Burkholderiaceae bacterium]|nr:TRAP transporter small permease [Burkholderiaceae bacterium]
MNAVQKLLQWLWRIEATICVVAFAGTAVALMADVLARELFGNGIFGAQRFAVWSNAIAGLLGFALVTAERGHLRPQFADALLPRALEPHVDRIGEVVSALICLGLFWFAVDFVLSSARLGERGMAIPILVWPIQLVLPWMFLSSALRHLAFAAWPLLRPAPRSEMPA